MDVLSAVLVVVWLSLFEGVSSLDNAIINAEVLRTMGEKARRWIPFAFTMSIPLILIGNGFARHIPEWLSPAVTILIIGGFWWKSVRAVRAAAVAGA